MSDLLTSTGGGSGATPLIEVVDLVKTFRRAGGKSITPVDHISLSVGSEELVVLLGPSGCGKTTLLRCVAGLERPDEGEIIVDGQVVFSSRKGIYLPTESRRLSMIFQSFALWPHMTVFENVAYPLETRRAARGEIRRRVMAVLELVGVGGLDQQFPGRISGGQQQRVALARALVASMPVVLFDEPLSNVDAQVRTQLRFELKRMQRNLRYAGLYVTHDQTEAMELGHRVAVLQNGRIAALGPPRDIYERPNTEYVAGFVGTANIWRGRILGRQNGLVKVASAFGDFSVAAGPAEEGPDRPASVVVRPESIRLSDTPPADGPNSMKVRIEAIMFAGPHTEFVVQRGEATARVWLQKDQERSGLVEGAEAWMSVAPANVSLVQPEAGEAPGSAT